MRNTILITVCVICLGLIGCRSFLDRVTPTDYPPQAAEYVGETPNDLEITSLYHARQVEARINANHKETQADLLHEAEKDKRKYQYAIGVIEASIKEASEWQALVIGSETQPMSILGILAGLSGGAVLGGRFIQRKEDWSETEHQADVKRAEEAAYAKGLLAAKEGA